MHPEQSARIRDLGSAVEKPAEIQITVTVEARDLRWAAFQAVKQRWLRTWLKSRWLKGVYCVIWVACAYCFLTVDWEPVRICSGMVLLWSVVIPAFSFLLVPWMYARSTMKSSILKTPVVHTFSEAGICSKFVGGSMSVEWVLLERAEETLEYVVVWGKQGLPFAIRKAQVTGAELEPLRGVLRHYLGEKAKLGERGS